MTPSYSAEQQVAIAAVQRACTLTASVFNKLVKNETLTKDDKSPVTGQCRVPMSVLVVLGIGCCGTWICCSEQPERARKYSQGEQSTPLTSILCSDLRD